MADVSSETAVSKTLLVGFAWRDWEEDRDEDAPETVERDEEGRGLDDREAVEREPDDDRPDDERADDERVLEERDEESERDEDEPREGAREEDAEREDEDREPVERSVDECERVPRRVDSLELTVHPPLFSSNDQIRPTVIHPLRQHLRQLCPPWRQLLQLFQLEY